MYLVTFKILHNNSDIYLPLNKSNPESITVSGSLDRDRSTRNANLSRPRPHYADHHTTCEIPRISGAIFLEPDLEPPHLCLYAHMARFAFVSL